MQLVLAACLCVGRLVKMSVISKIQERKVLCAAKLGEEKLGSVDLKHDLFFLLTSIPFLFALLRVDGSPGLVHA